MSSDDEFDALASPHPFRIDPELVSWRRRLTELESSVVAVRQALPDPRDARRVWDLQLDCPPISVSSLRHNASIAASSLVQIAEIDGIHVGFCVSLPGPKQSDPLFIQVIGVAPAAQRRGVAMELLAAAAGVEPHRDIALATQDGNVAARALIARFAQSTNSALDRVNLGTFRDRDLGIRRGMGYRVWRIRRQPS